MEKYRWNKKCHYGIRKLAVGACSVMIGASFLAAQTVQAEEANATEEETVVPEELIAKEDEKDEVAPAALQPRAATVETGEKTSSEGAISDEKENQLEAASQLEVDKVIEERKQDFNQDWQFKLNADQKEAISSEKELTNWQKLDLPHDWSIFFDFKHDSPAQNEGGQLNGGDAWYRKTFKLEEEQLDKRVRVQFDGVYMDSQVYVNGQLLGHYPNGYNAFSYDITDYLNKDGSENVIAVHVVNQQPSSRWYSGSGVYRDVSLHVTDKVHVAHYGTTILTPRLESQKDGKVDTEVTSKVVNSDSKDHEVIAEYQIVKKDGTAVTELVRTAAQKILAGQTASLDAVLQVERPQLWTVLDDQPALYELVTRIYRDGQLVDAKKDLFGYRYYNWTAQDGFSLNGEKIKFHGVSLHHDHGALGAEENYKAEYRRLKQMKDMGVNSIRTTHNPASAQTLQIAAELGLLVQEEAFDTWYGGKKPYDYGRFFEKPATHPEAKKGEKWSDYDLRTMVERGKNNPAIVMWSIGNEIGEASGDAHSLETVKRLVQVIKSVDKTRYVTMGADKFRFSDGSGNHEKIAQELDAVGFNYAENNYETLRAKHPDWLIYGSETSSATRTRGSYYNPFNPSINHDNSKKRHYEQSDYGNDRVGWGKTATESWTFDRDHAGYAGQFIWTGTDYIGEPTPWHNQNNTPVKSSYFGIVDTAGIPKNDYYLYQSQWVSAQKKPMVHLLPHWNWEDAKLRANVANENGEIPVRAFSNAASVELVVNGKSQGIKHFTKKETSDGRSYQEGATANELYLEWLVAYQPGSLEAIARDENGQEIARDKIVTAGEPAGVRLVKEDHAIAADGKDLTYIYYEIVDKDGVVVPTAKDLVRFNVQGQGQIVGVDNGEQASRERYKAQADGSWVRKAFNGKGLVIVKSTEQAGQFTLSAYSGNLKSDQVTVFTGKDTQAEKSVLGVESPRLRTTLGQAPALPTSVTVVYSDGSTGERPVSWSQADYSHEGQTLVEGQVDGRSVQAQVHVLGKSVQLPVVKRIAPATDLKSVDKSVEFVLTDGSVQKSQVTAWQIAASDESKLAIAGSHIVAHGEVNGETVTATLVVADDSSSQTVHLQASLGNQVLQFKNGVAYQTLAYGQEPGVVEAQADGAQVQVIQASRENGLRAQLFVVANDGSSSQHYVVQFLQEAPQIERLNLVLPKDATLKEDQTVGLSVIAHYQDGTEAQVNADRVEFTSQGVGKAQVRKGQLELHEPGLVTLKAQYGQVTGEIQFNILPNTEEKVVKSIRPVAVVTGLNQAPSLPKTVTVDFDKGFPKVHKVTWEAVPEGSLSYYHSFTLKGQVEGLDLPAQARVSVEGVVAVEEVSTTTPVGVAPKLPESVQTYLSNGNESSSKVIWDHIDPNQYATEGAFTVTGKLQDSDWTTKLHVRVSTQVTNGANISDQWTGSELPLAFASDSNKSDLVSNLNDKVISYGNEPANRWTNWNRQSEASAGILFGDSGILSKRSVDNLNVAFHEDHGVGVPKEYVIEYYVGQAIPTVPKDPAFVASEEHVFNDDHNWKAVTNLKAPEQLQAGRMTNFSFDKVDTYAIRIRMKRLDDKFGVSITELQVFAKQVPAEKTAEVTIQVDGKDLVGFNPGLQDYYLPKPEEGKGQVSASVSNHGLATIVPSVAADDPVRVIVKAENGEKVAEYRLHFTDDETLLSSKPVAARTISTLLQRGENLTLPSTLPVYFTGEADYHAKNLAVVWEPVSEESLKTAKEIVVHGQIVGTDLIATANIRITDEPALSLSDNPNYEDTSNQAFATETNDSDENSKDRVDYINDGDTNENRRWTNWSAHPDKNPEVALGVIFRENGQVKEKTVNQARVLFFADSGTDAPESLVLERYVGPAYDAPTYYNNYALHERNHSFNNPDNWEEVPFTASSDWVAGKEIQLRFAPTSSSALRLRMNRKANKNGVAVVELSFLRPSEEAASVAAGQIFAAGQALSELADGQTDYHLSYRGERPKITATGDQHAAVTIVDAKDDRLPVLVRFSSENGQTVKEYRVYLKADKTVIAEKGEAAVEAEKPSLQVEERVIEFETAEEATFDLYAGQTQVVQEGRNGKELIYTEVAPDGSRTIQSRQIVEEPVHRIVRVGRKVGTSIPSEGVK
ncbi:Ig-like domain-containing protein, partial [Streptococcus sp. DD10]|uniref:Ig-like domain-containing protein n=1 Tax=Streptococcus sp. DD10 TaxID=1777878 RepID=UPI0009EEA8BA